VLDLQHTRRVDQLISTLAGGAPGDLAVVGVGGTVINLGDREAVRVGREEKSILTLSALARRIDGGAERLSALVAAASIFVVKPSSVAQVAADDIAVGILKASVEGGTVGP
jgi:hypothetical protein